MEKPPEDYQPKEFMMLNCDFTEAGVVSNESIHSLPLLEKLHIFCMKQKDAEHQPFLLQDRSFCTPQGSE